MTLFGGELLRGEPEPIVSVLPDGFKDIYQQAADVTPGLMLSFFTRKDPFSSKRKPVTQPMFRLSAKDSSTYPAFWENVRILIAAASEQE